MNTYLGISQELTEEDIDLSIIENSSILYLEGYLWDLDNAKKAIKKSILAAKNSETMVSLSISDAFCVDRFREEFIDLINNSADLIFANESEIKSLYETSELDIGYKFGLEFFYSKNGRKFISKIRGKKIFLDLKLNDIPATCSKALMSLKDLRNLNYITLHASAGEESIKATVKMAKRINSKPK